jgi:hypothetical protein
MNSTSVFDLTKFKGITSQIQTNTISKRQREKRCRVECKISNNTLIKSAAYATSEAS